LKRGKPAEDGDEILEEQKKKEKIRHFEKKIKHDSM